MKTHKRISPVVLSTIIILFFSAIVLVLPITAQRGTNIAQLEESYVDISPAELESILEQLILTKARWQTQQSYRSAYLASSLEQGAGTNTTSILLERLERLDQGMQQLLIRSEYQAGTENYANKEEQHLLREDIISLSKQLSDLEKALSEQNKQMWIPGDKHVPNSPDSAPNPGAGQTELDSLISLLLEQTNPDLKQHDRIIDTLVSISKDTVYLKPVDPVVHNIPEQPETGKDTVVIIEQASPNDSVTKVTWPAIYFDVNSTKLDIDQLRTLRIIAEDFKPGGDKILITGYASPEGNPVHNQSLSARRAEAVSEALQKLNIDKKHIQTLYGGIDYRWTNSAAARRVEVSTLKQ